MSELEDKAKTLEEEAAKLIDAAILKLPANIGSDASARLVECIVSAAVLRVAALQDKAMNSAR